MTGKQHKSTFKSEDGVDEETANFGEGVALMAFLLDSGHISEDAAFKISREDYERFGFANKILKGGMRFDGQEFAFWIEDLPRVN